MPERPSQINNSIRKASESSSSEHLHPVSSRESLMGSGNNDNWTPIETPLSRQFASSSTRLPHNLANSSSLLDVRLVKSASALSEVTIDPALLSPPHSSDGSDVSPFKPQESDYTSLSMKRSGRKQSYHRRHRHGRRSPSHSKGKTSDGYQTPREYPLDLEGFQIGPSSTEISGRNNRAKSEAGFNSRETPSRRASNGRGLEIGRRTSQPQAARRWTLRSKSLPSSFVSGVPAPAILANSKVSSQLNHSKDAVPVSRRTKKSRRRDHGHSNKNATKETPAMITLRRATLQKPRKLLPRRHDAITFFPPPVLGRSSSSFISSFLGLQSSHGAGAIRRLETISSVFSHSNYSFLSTNSPRRTSVDGKDAQPSGQLTAEPVYTEVSIPPVRHTPAGEEQPDKAGFSRRYSTKYVTGSSIHEIIWDENVESSESNTTSKRSSRTATVSTSKKNSLPVDVGFRRQSVAMDKLETQLRQCDEQVRQASLGVQHPNQPSSNMDTVLEPSPYKTFQNLMSWNFGSKPDDSGHQKKTLPRSRAFRSSLGDPNSSTEAYAHVIPNSKTELDEASAMPTYEDQIEFFPPIGHDAMPVTQNSPRARTLDTSRGEDQTGVTGKELEQSDEIPSFRYVPPIVENSRKSSGKQLLATRSRLSEPSLSSVQRRKLMVRSIGRSSHLRRKTSNVETPDLNVDSSEASRSLRRRFGTFPRTESGVFARDSDDDFSLSRRNSVPADYRSPGPLEESKSRRISVQDHIGRIEGRRIEKDEPTQSRRGSAIVPDSWKISTSTPTQKGRLHALSDLGEVEEDGSCGDSSEPPS